MIKITEAFLKEKNACASGVEWFKRKRLKTLKAIIPALMKDNHFDYARWLLSRILSHPQQVQWAIYCAESVIKILEAKNPADNRPRKAIEAAKLWLENPTEENRRAANAAAYAATYAAYAADAAANAAYAAAYAAANAAAYAADAAYAAAYAADAAYAAANAAAYAAKRKIIAFAMNLLGEN